MFRLYHSNQLDVLKSIVSHLLKTQPQPDPFVQEHILVQSPGMAQWLKIELAQELSICANIEFPLPASFIWQIFVNLLDDVPKRSAFNKDAMAWNIMQRLPQYLEQQEFSELAQYLDSGEQLKIYQLAYKIADIYDQYLVYRPQWIDTWEQGSNDYCQEQPWQPILWRDLVTTISASGQSHYHRANLYQYLIDALDSRKIPANALPERIFVFGISALPPRYLQALHAISSHCDVHFFLNNPCQKYWGDIIDAKYLAKLNRPTRQKLSLATFEPGEPAEPLIAADQPQPVFDLQGELVVGNPLLASMGKLGRDNQYLLGEIQCSEIEAFVEASEASLLGQIANDILNLDDPCFIAQSSEDLSHSRHKKTIDNNDDSLVVHLCHSPMREVEVLYDQLLALFEANPQLTPKEVVVMMPDVNAYSPYIQAVFGMASGRQRIDFSISDRSAEQENPLLLSFLTLLKLPLMRHTSAELFSLLEVPAIMAKFELSPQSLERLKMWIEESGIRHGMGEDKVNNSWQFGLNRMFKGYSQIEPEIVAGRVTSPLWQDIFAYPEAVGMAAEQLGQLASFIDKIQHYSDSLASSRTFNDWHDLIEQLLADFYAQELSFEQELQLIKDCFVSLGEELTLAKYHNEISADVLFEYISSHLNHGQSSQRFLAGKLNFCTLMPMRSIPFKVVCLLGMNDGSYPRTIAPVGFDLMANDIQKGDRSRRDDDRYLFLEALLSAQQKLYISYCGRSIKDNSQRNPSVLVSELLDYIEQSYVLASDTDLALATSGANILNHLTVSHPLAPFSADYFCTNYVSTDYSSSDDNQESNPQRRGKIFSYQSHWRAALDSCDTQAAFLSQPLMADSKVTTIELPQLIGFFKHSSQYFLNQRLGVYFEEGTSDLAGSEPFNPGALDGYQIKATLLDSYLSDSVDRASERLRCQGILPHGHFSQLYLSQQTDLMAHVADNIKPYITDVNNDIEIDLAISKIRVQGWLKQHFSSGLIRYKSGKANIKFFIHCYIEYLCYCASALPTSQHLPMTMFCQDGSWQFGVLPKTLAVEHLTKLVNYFAQGQNRPLAFFINSGWAYISALLEKKSLTLLSDEKSVNAAFKKFQQRFSGGYMMRGEGDDDYIERCFGQLEPESQDQVIADAIALATDILLPLYQQLKELDDE